MIDYNQPSTMRHAPFFPFFAKEWVLQTTALKPVERGALVHLLCYAWVNDVPGSLPDDDALLATLSGLGKAWSKHAKAIKVHFHIEDGRLWHAALMRGFDEMVQTRKNRSAAGRKGAQKRWHPDPAEDDEAFFPE